MKNFTKLFIRSMGFSVLVAIIFLIIFHINDPFYDKIYHARTVFWEMLVPGIIFCSMLFGILLSIIIYIIKYYKIDKNDMKFSMKILIKSVGVSILIAVLLLIQYDIFEPLYVLHNKDIPFWKILVPVTIISSVFVGGLSSIIIHSIKNSKLKKLN